MVWAEDLARVAHNASARRPAIVPKLFALRKQLIPFAPERLLNAAHRRDQNVQFAALNFLDRSNIQICKLRELLLSDAAGGSLSAKICADSSEKLSLL